MGTPTPGREIRSGAPGRTPQGGLGLEGAEAILTLRAVISNGDFGEYCASTSTASASGSTPARPRGSTHSGPNPPSLETSCTQWRWPGSLSLAPLSQDLPLPPPPLSPPLPPPPLPA